MDNNNLFDPSKLRLSQNFVADTPVEKLLTMVPVRKPDKQWFVRTHPDPQYRMEMLVIADKEENEYYPVMPELANNVVAEARPMLMQTAITRAGVVFLWPVTLPDADGKHNPWHRSALDAQERARECWVRVVANKNLGGYDLQAAMGEIPEPIWPKQDFRELLTIAFRNSIITSLDHPLLRRLRGEV